MSGFKKFLMRGNVVDMAVGVVIGGAFGAVVASLVKDLLTPFIAMIVGQPDFSAIKLQVGSTTLNIGTFANTIVSFVLVAAAIYFFVVMPMNTLMARMNKPDPAPVPTTKKCKECASDIPLEAKRCRFCTQPA